MITTLPATTLLPPLLLALVFRPLSLNHINHLPAGPTSLIFALLAQYYAAIPHVYKYRVVTTNIEATPRSVDGILVSDKSTIYLIACQLALSQLPGSLISAILGWTIGLAWRSDFLPEKLSTWRVPGWMVGETGHGRGFEGLRRRLEGEGRASGIDRRHSNDVHGRQRRGMGRAILDQFRGAF